MLVDSVRCVEYVWRNWAAIHRRDPGPFIAVAHGRRTGETMREVAPELDVAAEVAVLDRMEAVAGTAPAAAIDGCGHAGALLAPRLA